jgi:hypothetical protein
MASLAWSGIGTVIVPSEVRPRHDDVASPALNLGESVVHQDTADFVSQLRKTAGAG